MRAATATKGATVLTVRNPRSTYVAIARSDRKTVIAEGTTIPQVLTQARATGKDFAMMSIPPKGCTCVY